MVVKNMVPENKVNTKVRLMAQTTTPSRILFIGVKKATFMNESL